MKILLVLLFFLFLIGGVSSSELSISPSEINFNIMTNQESCNQITISTEEGILIGEDKWAEKGVTERKFLIHTLSSEDLDLEVDYLKRFEMKNLATVDVCITAKHSGFYHGLLLYKKENSKAGVGIWMNVNVSKKDGLSLTGNSIKEINIKTIFILPIILTIILIILLLKLKKKRY
jgi:hypothetical protein